MNDVALSRIDDSPARGVAGGSSHRDEIDALADQIAVAAATMDSAMHGLLGAIRRFDQCKGWAWQGARSCAYCLK